MAKITYDNKVQLNENANIPNNQKCRAVDMNEIKNIVNGNDDEFIQYKSNIATGETYSTNEIKTNKVWIDGKPIYRKVILIDPHLFTGNRLDYSSNVNNIKNVINTSVEWVDTVGGNVFRSIPSIYWSNVDGWASQLVVEQGTLRFEYGSNISERMAKSNKDVIVILEYTKTTD